ncbi:MAG: hypothetical protein HPY69_07485 [Armatimonadetes bacterium]|nr:hypothetical protein [Armatimonadota bacterium]
MVAIGPRSSRHLWVWTRRGLGPVPRGRRLWGLLLLALLANLPNLRFALRPTYPNIYVPGWAWDDYHLLRGLERGHDWRAVLGWWHGDWPEGNRFYRPLPSVSLWLDYLVWGWNPWGYLLTAWVLYTATVAALGAFVASFTGRRVYGLAALLSLAWFPLTGGSTVLAFVNPRAELLCGLAMLVALHSGLSYSRRGTAGALAGCALASAAALLSKELALVLPLLAAVVLLLAPRPGPWLRRLVVPCLMMALVIGWYMLYQAVLPGRLPRPGDPALPLVASSWHQILVAFTPAAGVTAMWLLSEPTWGDLLTSWLPVRLAQLALALVALGLLLRWQWRFALLILAWPVVCWLPMLGTHTHAGHYFHIPQLMVSAAAGTALWLGGQGLTQWLRRELRRHRG